MDLAELMYKLFDNWNDEEEVLNVPDVFDICFQDVTEELKKVLSPVSIIYKSRLSAPELPGKISLYA